MRTNELVFNRFRIESKAGAGGMGTVYRAHDVATERRVALKVVRGDEHLDGERFRREAAALASVEHDGVVRYVAHGEGPEGHYLAMEWLEGEDLSRRLQGAPLTQVESVAVAVRVASAVGAAHARGIVHRDIKPRNVFLVGGDIHAAKLIDFGIARLRAGAELTLTGAMLGTPGYMAPEQAEGARDVDARADVFSIGCVLFRCLTGEKPFAGESVLAVLAKTVLEQTPRVSDFRQDVPRELDDLVARLLAKDKRARPANGAEVAWLLGRVRASRASVPPAAVVAALTAGERRVMCIVVAGIGAPGDVKDASPRAARSPGFAASRALEAAVRVAAERHGGHVESLAEGSHLVVVAGGAAATDLAAQAARCALALRDLLPEMPIALATGAGVAMAAEASRPAFALVDRAVSMLTQPGAGIRLDDATAGLLDARFVVEPVPRTADAGSLANALAPVATGLRLTGLRDVIEGQRTLLGKPYPCVGRDHEISTLQQLVLGAFDEARARGALVVAPAGRGKSRLRFEVLRRVHAAGARATVLFARGDSVSAGSPFGLLAPALRRVSGVVDGDASTVVRRRLRARVARNVRPEDLGRVAGFLGEVLGVSPADDEPDEVRSARADAVTMGDGMQAAFCDFLEAELEAQPVLLVLEDLHWGDLPSVRFIDAALRALPTRRLAVLAFARPEVHETFPGLWLDHGLLELRLPALGPRASGELVRAVLGDATAAATVDRIVERSGGNAFYLEELIRAVAVGMPSEALPDTVLGMVQARLDGLGADLKRVLRAASLFGQTFWRGGVEALLGDDAEELGVPELLAELVDREVVAAQGEVALGEGAFIFRHALLRDAAYAMLTDDDRALGHRLAAQWLEATGLADGVVLAEHFDHGGQPERAVAWYRRAADHALGGNDLDGAVHRAELAIRCGADATHADLCLIICEARKWQGRLAEAYGYGIDAVHQFTKGSGPWFRAVGEVIALAGQLGRGVDLDTWSAEALAAAPDARVGAQVTTLCRAVPALLQQGKNELADRILTRVGALAPRLGPEDALPTARVHAAWATRARAGGEPAAALARHQLALIAFEEIGDLRNAALTRIHVGVEQAELGDYEGAELSLRHVVRAASRLGLSNVLGWALANLGDVLTRRGALAEAIEVLDRAAAMGHAQQSVRLEAGASLYRARVDLASGRPVEAERRARDGVTLSRDIPPLRASALAVLADALLAQPGREAEAVIHAEVAVTLLRDNPGEGEVAIHLAHIEALARVGEVARARDAALAAEAILIARARGLDDPARARALGAVRESARLLELARFWRDDAARVR